MRISCCSSDVCSSDLIFKRSIRSVPFEFNMISLHVFCIDGCNCTIFFTHWATSDKYSFCRECSSDFFCKVVLLFSKFSIELKSPPAVEIEPVVMLGMQYRRQPMLNPDRLF